MRGSLRLPFDDGTAFCIDQLEVTQARTGRFSNMSGGLANDTLDCGAGADVADGTVGNDWANVDCEAQVNIP